MTMQGTIVHPTVNEMPDGCIQISEIKMLHPVTHEGCEECLRDGTDWVHLRICLVCGHVGCCDSSEHLHARKHWNETGHPMIQTFNAGETWEYCYPTTEIQDDGVQHFSGAPYEGMGRGHR